MNQLRNRLDHIIDIVRLRSLRIDPHGILRPTSTHETPPILVLSHDLVNLGLDIWWGGELTLRGSLDGSVRLAVYDLDFAQPVRHVRVGSQPLLDGEALVRQNDFDEQEVRDGVADGLVDEVCKGFEGVEGVGLGW